MYLMRLTARLVLVLAVILGAVIAGSHLQPPPARYARLHLDACAPPCWLGIQPGVTTFDEAKALVNATFGSREYAHIDETNGELNVELYRATDNIPCLNMWLHKTATSPAVIDSILFGFPVYRDCSTFDLADMIILFGPPDYVVMDGGNYGPVSPQNPTITYRSTPSTGIWIQFRYYPSSLETFVDTLAFYSGDLSLDTLNPVQSWRGIARFNR